MKTLIIIPARSGSKGIENKNMMLLEGKPLIYYTIKEAKKLFNNSSIHVSTDSLEIKAICNKYNLNIPFLRPKELSTDKSNIRDVILYSLSFFKSKNIYFDNILLLQPTSPLRKAIHIKEAMGLYNDKLDMVVSVTKTSSNPYYVLFEENKDGFLVKCKKGNYTRRQDVPDVWEYNGAIYLINTKSLLKKEIYNFSNVKKYVMNPEFSVDIDDDVDFELCKILLNK